MAGSLVAGLASNGTMLIAGRTLQGLGGDGIVIMVTVVIADPFPLRERAKYYAFSSIVWAIARALGPVLGGVFTQTTGWRWCFFINLPFDAISLLLLWFVLQISTPTTSIFEGLRTFDWIGSAAIAAGTICFLCGLEGGASGRYGWSSVYILCLLLSGIALVVGFVLYELYFANHPIIPMRIFVGRVTVAALTAATFHSFIFIAYDYFLPLYFQVVLEATPIISGIYLFALIIPLSLVSAGTGWFIKKTNHYDYASWFGSIIMTLGTGFFIDFKSKYQLWKIIVFQVIAGFGAGPLFLSPMTALQNHLRKEDIAAGTSAFTFLRTIASSISIVVGGVILQKGLNDDSFTETSAGHQAMQSIEEKKRYVDALSKMWIFYTALGSIVILSSLMITKPRLDRANTGETLSGSTPDENLGSIQETKAPPAKDE